ncbi:MAG: hypothetical protein IJ757_09390 [Clostridiales bacterium]|nr:hypothetical protein [Clostridiales bacterium]
MHKYFRSLLTAVLSLLIAIAVPLSSFGLTARADDNDIYSIYGYAKQEIITAPDGSKIPGYGFCLDLNRSAPYGVNYRRTLLSESSFSDDTKMMLLSVMCNLEGLYSYARELQAEGNTVAGNFANSYSTTSNNFFYQRIIWAITHNEVYGNEFVGSSEYEYRVSLYGGYSDDPLNDPASLWNVFFVPIFDYLRANAPSSDWDCYLYIPVDNNDQRILSTPFRTIHPEVTVGKIVVDGEGNPVAYNGENDEGFNLNIGIYDTAADIFVSNETFYVTRADGSIQDVQTNDEGRFDLTIAGRETVTISGFDSENYSVYISEDTTGLGDYCSYLRIDSTTSVTVEGEYSVIDVTEQGSAITVVNSFVIPTPEPIPVSAPVETEPTLPDQIPATVDSVEATPAEVVEELPEELPVEQAVDSEQIVDEVVDTDVLDANRDANNALPDTGEGVSVQLMTGLLMIALSGVVFTSSVYVRRKSEKGD